MVLLQAAGVVTGTRLSYAVFLFEKDFELEIIKLSLVTFITRENWFFSVLNTDLFWPQLPHN